MNPVYLNGKGQSELYRAQVDMCDWTGSNLAFRQHEKVKNWPKKSFSTVLVSVCLL